MGRGKSPVLRAPGCTSQTSRADPDCVTSLSRMNCCLLPRALAPGAKVHCLCQRLLEPSTSSPATNRARAFPLQAAAHATTYLPSIYNAKYWMFAQSGKAGHDEDPASRQQCCNPPASVAFAAERPAGYHVPAAWLQSQQLLSVLPRCLCIWISILDRAWRKARLRRLTYWELTACLRYHAGLSPQHVFHAEEAKKMIVMH